MASITGVVEGLEKSMSSAWEAKEAASSLASNYSSDERSKMLGAARSEFDSKKAQLKAQARERVEAAYTSMLDELDKVATAPASDEAMRCMQQLDVLKEVSQAELEAANRRYGSNPLFRKFLYEKGLKFDVENPDEGELVLYPACAKKLNDLRDAGITAIAHINGDCDNIPTQLYIKLTANAETEYLKALKDFQIQN